MPHLFELTLNNIHLGGGYLDGELVICSNLIEQLLRVTSLNGAKLMKLKLTKINLRQESLIAYLCDTIKYNKNLVFLDIS